MAQPLLKRPKGMPLLVCECTRPKPWPLFVRHTPRHYEVPLDGGHPDNVIVFEVEWYVQSLRFHFAPPEASEEGELLCGRITGRCPVCSTAFILRFRPSDLPTVIAYFYLVSDERAPVEVISAKARRTTLGERTQQGRHYITHDALCAIAPQGDIRLNGDARTGYTVTIAERNIFHEGEPAPLWADPLLSTLNLRQQMPQVSDVDRENLQRATITINCARERVMGTGHTADWQREGAEEQGWPFGK